ncbi:aminodeoxychorismate lyase [Mycobacterium hodleri]|uniref:Aminodeoxychorismate lyase n=1 Tax=Mycolicibacterium hodleri TaxID=49897 RepID=A0A544VXN7_9MYCO|nr:aminodeoxychorismate lyase [Mycolicibacterium hodleri]TQR84751.1 aminodeoxychorismate lyase [Mycolicibacterium hodleri]
MASHGEIVVTLAGEVVTVDHPVVRVDDPLFGRGDGVFETLLLRNGRGCLIDAHLERLARSAATVALPPPDVAQWRAPVASAAQAWPGAGDAVMRLVFGRGRGGGPIGFVTVSPLPDRALVARRDGVSAMTLDRGFSVADDPGNSGPAPWSIAGVKSLSYAANAAALRHAQRLGVGDVVLTSTDGFVLEGPRSNVVIVARDGVLATPPSTLPILAGTTVKAVFEVARRRGETCEERPLRTADLLAAKGVWLLSSITLAARVHTLDGAVLPAADGVADMAEIVDEAVGGLD